MSMPWRRYSLGVALLCIMLLTAYCQAAEPALPSRLAVNSLLLDGAQVDGLMVVVGERGHILYSHDQGHNWQQANVPSRVLLTAVYMHDGKLGWAVGHDATILRTRDGGKQWQEVYFAPQDNTPLLDVWFKDEKHGFAVGAYGLMLATEDGGDTWQRRWINEDEDYHLNQISKTDERQWMIAAEAGLIYRSDDDGKTWQSLDSPYHGSFFGILRLSAQKLLLFGLRGHLFLSSDQGDSWTTLTTQTTAMLTSGLKTKAGICFIGGLGGVVLIDRQCDGQSIEQRQLPSRSGITALLESDQNAIILIGESGITRFQP